MRLRRLEVERFRGVRLLDWRHIPDTAALVGPGDSGKSTVLDAIERVLSPKWNVSFDDSDFWKLAAHEPIVIRATLTDLASRFYQDTKFGLMLHALDSSHGIASPAVGAPDEVYALVIELRVERNLEPQWSVVDAEGVRHSISAREREAIGMLRVGAYVDQHLGWTRGSVLARLTEKGDAIAEVLADAMRQARAGFSADGLTKLNDATHRVEALAKKMGVALQETLVPRVDPSSLSAASGSLSLHDGEVPTRRAGLGTRRLLAVAMQREAASNSGVTLIDEFEHGLEPHRIRQLFRVFRGRSPEDTSLATGQLVLTTHSPTVLSELDASEVSVTRRSPDGSVTIRCLPAAVGYVLKHTPDALLARKVIVGEGATEQGLCIGLDGAWTLSTDISFAYRGVAVVDGGGGTQPADVAGHLVSLGFEVALVVDSDVGARTGRAAGAQVLAWHGNVSTEQRLAADLPIEGLKQMTVLGVSNAKRGIRAARDAIADGLNIPRAALVEDDPESWVDVAGEAKFRKVFGDLAKEPRHSWFKTREQGESLGRLVAEFWQGLASTPARATFDHLKKFAHE